MMSRLPEDFIFSQSSLQDYVDCPRRFELKYLLHQGWPSPEVDDLQGFEQHVQQGERLHHIIHQHLAGIPADLLRKHIADADVKTWFERYLAHGLNDLPEQRYPEKVISVAIGDFMVLAKFDLLAIGADRAVIVDWKTNRRLPKREQLERRLQTIVYRYVLAKGGASLGRVIAPEQITMRYWFTEHEATHEFQYSQAQFEADERYLLSLMEAINTQTEFPLTADEKRCQYCIYRTLCERGSVAGSLSEWDIELDVDLTEFTIDIDQIAEIEF